MMRIALSRLVTVGLLAVVLISGWLPNALAVDVNGRYFALGVGSRSCSDHLEFAGVSLNGNTFRAKEN